jgi:hypothetical protein
MANVAILVGNTKYQALSPLNCCAEDLRAIKDLLDATAKFDAVEMILDAESAQLKDRIREKVDACESVDEIFFYFTGHGFQHEAEFFFCATNFDAKRPNETGLSNTELHTLLKSTEAKLVVKVVDACSSGTLLIKSDGSFIPLGKSGFNNLIQIASCLESQNSLAGDPLSIFTEKFRAAVLRKTEGPVYYSDIVNVLRDDFLNNNSQTPHFVSQGTGREEFVDDAKKLDGLRAKLSAASNIAGSGQIVPSVEESPVTTIEILQKAETKFAKKQVAIAFISQFFEALSKKAAADLFGDLFDAQVIEHSNYMELTTRAFIIRVLVNEKRPDNFVTATIKPEHKRRDPLGLGLIAAGLLGHPDDSVSDYDLSLNCEIEKVQLKVTLTPKFVSLRRFVLVVSCVPSLEVCYVMEMLTQHSLKDWGVFDAEGLEVARRWYTMNWTDSCDFLVEKIFDKLQSVVQDSVNEIAHALSQT